MSIIHYYSLCWNEEKILPFVLDYYAPFCEKMVIMDNESDDNSQSIIRSHPNAEMRSYSSNGEIRDDIYLEIKNNIWKESRGKADWVIVCDTDEILYHPDLPKKLDELKDKGISIIKPHGYNMFAEAYPQKSLMEITNGIKDNRHMGKCIIFNPNLIEEINFKTGCHKCFPTGQIQYYRKDDMKLLHYKCLDLEFLIDRFEILKKRLSNYNMENKFGKHYMAEKELIKENYFNNLSKATNVFKSSPRNFWINVHNIFIKRSFQPQNELNNESNLLVWKSRT